MLDRSSLFCTVNTFFDCLFKFILLHVQSLKKEADQLKVNLLKAEAVTKAAKKEYHDETEKLNKLQSQFKAADDIRQEAYALLQSLKKQSYEKVLLIPGSLSYYV